MKNKDAVIIGEKLKYYRKSINLTQKTVQKELRISGLKTYESGLHIPSYRILKKLVALYGTSFDDILAFDESSFIA